MLIHLFILISNLLQLLNFILILTKSQKISSSLDVSIDPASLVAYLGVHSVRVRTSASTAPACRSFDVILPIVLTCQRSPAVALATVFSALIESSAQHRVVQTTICSFTPRLGHQGDQDLLQLIGLGASALKSTPSAYQTLVVEIVNWEVERIVSQADKAYSGSQDSLLGKLDQGKVVFIIVRVVSWMDQDLINSNFLSCILFSFFAMSTYPRKQGVGFNLNVQFYCRLGD